MGSSDGWRTIGLAAGLVACGAAASTAWHRGLWGSLTGAALTALWLAGLNWWSARAESPASAPSPDRADDSAADRLLLDAAPTPMLAVADGRARALNRAARRLFATDDRILPAPADLFDPVAGHLRHEGRQWRVDRVTLGGGRSVAALIDVEQEERAAEARASAEMIHVVGHELLNGLAPIVSLAESGEALLDRADADPALLREILGTLARRAEGLQRFTAAYRELARLPAPRRVGVSMTQLTGDLARSFAGRWPNVALTVAVAEGPEWRLDRDQIGQALWALLQNAAESATAARGEDARVTLTTRSTGGALHVAVGDNGAGVTPDDAARIFRPFYTTKLEGTGIGLSLARQIAHAHGGSLLLMPQPGTTFLLSLPKLDAGFD